MCTDECSVEELNAPAAPAQQNALRKVIKFKAGLKFMIIPDDLKSCHTT